MIAALLSVEREEPGMEGSVSIVVDENNQN